MWALDAQGRRIGVMRTLGNPVQAKFAEHNVCELRRIAVGYDTPSKNPSACSSP